MNDNWIKCSERLPESEEYVVAYLEYYELKEIMYSEIISLCFYSGRVKNGKWYVNYKLPLNWQDHKHHVEVTHWQPYDQCIPKKEEISNANA